MRIHAGSAAALEKTASQVSVLDPFARDARQTFQQQAAAIAALEDRIDGTFGKAVRLLYETEGHVVVTGIGKSGLIGQKIAATLASTGTPSFFVHAAEAFHGDLGKITEDDTVILLSYSGETDELVRLLKHLHGRGNKTVALCGSADSRVATGVDVFLDISVEREVCPNNLAPTTSTLTQLAMGDALAVALMRLRGFEEADFADLHPGGGLGRRLTSRVHEAMVTELTIVSRDATARDCILALARARVPVVLVQEDGDLAGVVAEAELRRALEGPDASLDMPVAGFMNESPAMIESGALLGVAQRRMEREGTDALVVADADGHIRGVVTRSSLA
jgi:arabinose-5-phosphate isomerase